MRTMIEACHRPWSGRIPQRLGALTLLLLAVALGGCGAAARSDFDLNRGEAVGTDPEAAHEVFASEEGDPLAQLAGEWRYRIQGGDELEIVFFTHPDQNRFVTVRPDGYVTLPYLGDVRAEDLTPAELAAQLQETYAEVLVSPRVDVIVQKMGARYYVLGEVFKPGEFAYERRVDMLQALARAGGYRDTARLTNIVLLRRGYGEEKSFAAILNLRDYMDDQDREAALELRPFDIVWVPRSNLSKWDNSTEQLLRGILLTGDIAIKGWSLVNFDDVFKFRRF